MGVSQAQTEGRMHKLRWTLQEDNRCYFLSMREGMSRREISRDGGARMAEQGRRRKGGNQGWNDQDNEGGNGGNDGDEDNRDGGK